MTYKRYAAALLVALPLLTSCKSDDKLAPRPAPPIDAMFERYVSLGNSFAAGLQSAGINDSTQRRAYPLLLAAAMETPFNYPQLSGRGCPPPFTNNVTQSRVGGGTGSTCDLRTTVLGTINNVAVPGARVQELLTNFGTPVSASNALTTFFLGGKTQLEAMEQVQPTFVTVWIGNNDVLGSLTSQSNPGDPALITPLTAFQAQVDTVLDQIQATGADALVIGVGDVTLIPYASRAAIWYCLKNGGCPAPLPPQNPVLAAIPTFTVNVNCAPVPPAGGGLAILVPWTIGLTKISTALGGTPATIDCSVDNEVVTTPELIGIATAVGQFNGYLQAAAAARSFAYLDINPTLQALVATGAIPPFPDITTLPAGPVGFGPYFSQDGVHPSSLAHRLVADSAASAINQHYGTSLPVPVCGTVSCPAP